MRIAIVGCGYVGDFYVKTLPYHPELELVGVMDRDATRAKRFSSFHKVPRIASLDEVISNPRVDIVVNLTNPASHYEVSKAALDAGKHVYSEKPLAMKLEDAEALVALAASKGLELGGAPCGVLGETAQTLWKALREDRIGKVRLVYAELDDGPIHLMGFRSWKSDSGSPWPYKDEFEVGCTLEHAGYYVTWLAAFFGPAKAVTSFASLTIPDKGVPVSHDTPDFSVACIEFDSGVVARLTCSIFATHDHALRIFGDRGILSAVDCWDYGSPVFLHKRTKLGLKAEKHPRLGRLVGLGPMPVKLVRKPTFALKSRGANRMDFARGVAEMAAAIREKRPSRMSSRFALHVNEIVLAIQSPPASGARQPIRSTFDPIAPAEWARGPKEARF
jgi:predicted dehydrogenase